jgi:hypothetical protein
MQEVHSTMCCAERLELSVGWCTQSETWRVVSHWSHPGVLWPDELNPVIEIRALDIKLLPGIVEREVRLKRPMLRRSKIFYENHTQ